MPNGKPNGKQECDPIFLWTRDLVEKPCDLVTDFGDALYSVYRRMSYASEYYQSIGLSAPQIGVFQAVSILTIKDLHLVMVNPEIVSSKGQSTEYESCTSIPGCTSKNKVLNNRAKVTRASEIDLRWYGLDGEKQEQRFNGYVAHAIQHEVDHLSGIFFIDRCGDLARGIVMRNYENFKRALQDE
jgi:peptide deformylase